MRLAADRRRLAVATHLTVPPWMLPPSTTGLKQ